MAPKADKGKAEGKADKGGPPEPECCGPILVYPALAAISLAILIFTSQVLSQYKKLIETTRPYKKDMRILREAIGEWLSNESLKRKTELAVVQLTELEAHINKELDVYDQRRIEYSQTFISRPSRRLWIRYGLSNYYISQREKNWFDAERYCTARDSHLASILNYEEQDFITSRISELSWIGLSKQNAFDSWEWTDKSAFTTQYWSNVTSKSEKKEKEQDCVTIAPTINTYNWEQANCYKLNRWVCKKNQEQDKS